MLLLNIGNISQYCNDAIVPFPFQNQDIEHQIVKEWFDPTLPKTIMNSWQDTKSLRGFTSMTVLNNEELLKRRMQLYRIFEESYERNKAFFTKISFDKISSDFRLSLDSILDLSPNAINVGISSDECVFIYSEFESKSVFFDLFFEEDGEETDALLNIMEGKKSICSCSGSVDNSLQKLREFVPLKDNDYELSFSSITPY